MMAGRGELQKASILFCHAIQKDPYNPEAYQRLGEALLSLAEWDNAQACFYKAISLKNDYAEAYNYLGIVFKHKQCLSDAEKCYHQAIALKPDYAEAFHNLGNCFKVSYNFVEAEKAYLQALKLKPELLDTRFSLATLYFLQGKYDKGWTLYDSRLNWKEKFRLNIPIWQGETLAGRKILLFYEQGFGDMVQFLRYAYKVAEMAETTVWIQKPLARLLNHSQNVFSVCSSIRQINPADFDFACSLFSLPAKLNFSPHNFLADQPYLCPSREIVEKWRGKMKRQAAGKKKIGVVWAGNPEHTDDQNRSIPFETFRYILDIKNATWFSLQVGKGQIELKTIPCGIIDCSEELVDFAETAGVIKNLDLVITVDTAVSHLSGAVGKETWVLLPYRPDWRWGVDSERCPWYPTMHLFRQSTAGDWQTVLEKVKNALQEWLSINRK